MLCQKCQQRPATVFFSQTVGNQTTQSHLCEPCAQEHSQAFGGINPFNFNPFANLSEFINNFMPWGEAQIAEVPQARSAAPVDEPQLQCPHCGYQFLTFRQNGRLGCTHCYESFQTVLDPLIARIHGNVRHVEDLPPVLETVTLSERKVAEVSDNPDVVSLREKLKLAVLNEKYEEAARLRDQIHNLGT